MGRTVLMYARRLPSFALFVLWVVAGGPAACGGSQTQQERGEVFCESYENAFTGQCRQNCEAERVDDASQEGAKECETQCNNDLKRDDTFGDSCADRLREL